MVASAGFVEGLWRSRRRRRVVGDVGGSRCPSSCAASGGGFIAFRSLRVGTAVWWLQHEAGHTLLVAASLPVIAGVTGDALAIQQVGVPARAGWQVTIGGRRPRVSGWRRTRQGAVGRGVKARSRLLAALGSRVYLGRRRAAEVECDDVLGEMERGEAGGDGAKNEAYDWKDDAVR